MSLNYVARARCLGRIGFSAKSHRGKRKEKAFKKENVRFMAEPSEAVKREIKSIQNFYNLPRGKRFDQATKRLRKAGVTSP